MTIAQSLVALQNAKTDMANAITDKGVTLNEGDGFADFAAAIRSIKPPSEYGLITFTAIIPTAATITIT